MAVATSDVGIRNFVIDLHNSELSQVLREPRLERAIGVIYVLQTERQSHYFDARLSDQFDAVIHLAGEPPETFPTGI
jgi:erythromycin esterase-like protein